MACFVLRGFVESERRPEKNGETEETFENESSFDFYSDFLCLNNGFQSVE